MTAEEMERAIGFLLESQARHDAQIGGLREMVAETNRVVQLHAETQTEFIQAVTGHMESQREINASMRDAIRELVGSQSRTDARLDRLAATVERFIEGRGGNPGA